MRIIRYLAFSFLCAFSGVAFAAPQYSSLGVVSNNADPTLAAAGDVLTFTLTLSPADDANGVGQITFDVGAATGLTTSTFPVGGSSTTHQVTYTALAGQNGPVSVTGITFQNSLAEDIQSLPGFPLTPSPNVTMDTTDPAIFSTAVSTSGAGGFAADTDTVTYAVTFTENATVSINTASSATNITTLTTELDASDASTDDLVFTATAVDNGTVTPTVDFDLTDAAGNTVTISSLGVITGGPAITDTTAPTFSAINAVSDNADPTIAIAGDTITFTLDLGVADTWSGTNLINFDIGSNSFSTAFFTSDTTPDASKTVDYVVPVGEEGLISVTGVTFTDFVGNAITGFVGPYTPTPSNVDVDSIDPIISTIIPVPNPTNDNTPSYSFSSSENGTITYGGSCDSATTAASLGGNTIDFNALVDAIYSDCTIRVTDAHGNLSSILNVNTFEVDTQAPSVQSASVATTGNPGYAIVGDQVTFTVNFDESVTVSAINTASSATNITTLTQDFDIVSGSSDQLVFTTVGGDNGAVAPTVDFDITDAAGNTATINSLGTITGGPIQTDTIVPTLNPVTIASNNANPAYAITNDTVTVSFTGSETLAGGTVISTLFGEAASVANPSGDDWTASLMTDGDETEGPATFTIDFEDLAGNVGVQVVSTTDASSVIYDNTPAAVSSVSIISDNPYVTDAPVYYARVGNTVTLTIDPTENIQTPTGTILGKVPVFNNPSGDIWTATVTVAGGDAEGTIAYSIDIQDLAGTTTLNISATTDGTSVLMDRTNPTNPTNFVDLGGAQTSEYKDSALATFNWTGDADGGSGVEHFDLRVVNANLSMDVTTPVVAPTRTFTPAPALADSDDYLIYITVFDKAGNSSVQQLMYTQKYGVFLSGNVTDQSTGQPLSNVGVQLVSRYGETCDGTAEDCYVITDATGNYQILVIPTQDFRINFSKRQNYQTVSQSFTALTTNMVLNPTLSEVESGMSQGSDLFTTINAANGNITVRSLAGSDITANEISNYIEIQAFSTIESVTPTSGMTVTDMGGNVYRVYSAGTLGSVTASSGVNLFTPAGTSTNAAGQTRAEKAALANKRLTYAETIEFIKEINSGKSGQTLYYTNHNGYRIFAGYVNGKLSVMAFNKKSASKRPIVYRASIARTEQFHSSANGKTYATFKPSAYVAQKVHKSVSSSNRYESARRLFSSKGEELKPLRTTRTRQADSVQTIINRRKYMSQKKDKFARTPVTKREVSRIEKNNYHRTRNNILLVNDKEKVVELISALQ